MPVPDYCVVAQAGEYAREPRRVLTCIRLVRSASVIHVCTPSFSWRDAECKVPRYSGAAQYRIVQQLTTFVVDDVSRNRYTITIYYGSTPSETIYCGSLIVLIRFETKALLGPYHNTVRTAILAKGKGN